MIEDLDHLTFELSQMKSLEVLLVESVHIQQLETKYTLPDQLLKLEVRRSLKLLQVRGVCVCVVPVSKLVLIVSMSEFYFACLFSVYITLSLSLSCCRD